MLNKTDRLLLALSLLPRVGRKLIRQILNTPSLLDSKNSQKLHDLLSANNRKAIEQFQCGLGDIHQKVEACNELMDQHDIKFITISDDKYPPQLLHIPDYPPYLFYKGDISIAKEPQIAIVGSRNASKTSLRNAFSFSEKLGASGLVITSGLAQGVDAYAHNGAVNNGFASIAVMGTGLDSIYPKKHLSLATTLLNNGCWISEYLPGSKPIAANFPRRNRIISGLSLGVLVVEARERSGTLITARMAIEQNRSVFAIPGPIDYQGSMGCHLLIRDGATLVQNPLEIIQDLAVELKALCTNQSAKLEQKNIVSECKLPKYLLIVLDKIEFSAVAIDTLSNTLKQSPSQLQSSLMELELLGYIECAAGQCQRIK